MTELFEFGYEPGETDYPLNDPAGRASLIGSFQMVFNGDNSPYDENWDYRTTNDFIEWTAEQDYEGVLAVDDGRVVGFSWGYRVDPDTVDVYDKFPEELENVESDIFDGETFIIDEVGVLPGTYRGKGLGTRVEGELIEKVEARNDIDRIMQRTQWSPDNTGKLRLDGKFDFKAFLNGEENQPVTQEVGLVGNTESDTRIYLGREV